MLNDKTVYLNRIMGRFKNHIGIFTNWFHYFRLANSIWSIEEKDKQLGAYLASLIKKINQTDYSTIENIRNQQRNNSTIIMDESFGGGSRLKRKNKSVGEIVRLVSIRNKYGRFLHALVSQQNPPIVLELGTAIGMSAMYLAFEGTCKVITVEGNRKLLEIAQKTATKLNLSNIEFVCGDFDEVLPTLIKKIPDNTLVFVDGNHSYEATLRYYRMLKKALPNGIWIFDDIYWSAGMKKAWEEIARNENLVLDIFQFGIVIPSETSSGYYRFRY